jgi:hypothetical protein
MRFSSGWVALDISHLVSQVDVERIYQHILELEGTRHPVDAPEKLDEAANYILSEFKNYGLQTHDQEFKVEGFDTTFRNVEGAIGNEGSELLVVSHYDTVQNSPGANDNGSGIAVMLESARILAQEKRAHKIRFISFSLEEFNFVYTLKARTIAESLGLMDKHNRYTTAHTHGMMKQIVELQSKAFSEGKNLAEALAKARIEFEDQLTKSEIEYSGKLEEMYKGLTLTSEPGKIFTIGSGFWVDEVVRTKKDVLGVLCLETIGYTSEKEHSQKLPEGMQAEMFQTYGVSDVTVGNFIAIIGDANSDRLAQSFCNQSKRESIQLPYACLLAPLSYEEIVQLGLLDLLRSDHAPFWRKGIPALMLTDTANFRYPFYHTQADTIDKLDFDFMTKVCKATIAASIDFTSTPCASS